MDNSKIPFRISKRKCAQNKIRGRVGTDTGNRAGGGGSSSCGGRCVCVLIHATCTSIIPAQGHNHIPEVSLNTAQTKKAY